MFQVQMAQCGPLQRAHDLLKEDRLCTITVGSWLWPWQVHKVVRPAQERSEQFHRLAPSDLGMKGWDMTLAQGEVVQRKSPFCRGHRENCEPAQTSPRSSKQLRAAGLRVQRVEGRNRVGCCREGGVTEEGLIFLFEKAQPKIHHYVSNRNNWAQDQVLKSLLWEAGMTLLWVASLHTEASLLFTSGLIPGK